MYAANFAKNAGLCFSVLHQFLSKESRISDLCLASAIHMHNHYGLTITPEAWCQPSQVTFGFFAKSLTLHPINFQSTLPPEGLGYLFAQSVLVNHRFIWDSIMVFPLEYISALNTSSRTALPCKDQDQVFQREAPALPSSTVINVILG